MLTVTMTAANRKERGFTLIELLVVIAIIGILASVVLASLSTAREDARDARRIADLRQIQTALEVYYSRNKHYPNMSATCRLQARGVETAVCGLEGSSFTGSNPPVVPTFMPAVPRDPTFSSTQKYYWYSINTVYCVGARLEVAANVPTSTCKDDTSKAAVEAALGGVSPLNYIVGP